MYNVETKQVCEVINDIEEYFFSQTAK